ncbi:MAG: ABC transporter ATP-binding protein [Paralcaligenes sp.]
MDTKPHPEARADLLTFSDVSKSFTVDKKDRPAVYGVNCSIQEGEIITLVGPSGCGKSTLLNMAAGLYKPTTGKISYRGTQIEGLNHRIGYITQSDHLLPWRDVASNILVPLEIMGMAKNERKDRVAELIELVGLEGFEKSYPGQLSGGMRKRTALARLLAYDPETLLMDEPFGALDAQLRLMLQIELLRIARRFKKTVLFVTHDLDEAVALADRCIVFGGRPGTIVDTLNIPLSKDRDLMTLRFNKEYVEVCAKLWQQLSGTIAVGAQ